MIKMRIYRLIAFFMLMFKALASGEQQVVDREDSASREAALASKISLLYKNQHRWSHKLENLHRNPTSGTSPMTENEIPSVGHQQEARQSYACGRASGSQKHDKIQFDRDRGSASSGGPTHKKYRPFEIRTPRIIGGDETSPGEFPWTVSLKLNGQPICGGSLINRSWILTAAHCVVGYNPKNLTVRLGAYRIKDSSEQQTVDSPISLFVVHKQYSMPRPFSNDIALLKMTEPVVYSDFIIPICLPTEDQISTTLSNEIASDHSASRALGNAANPTTASTGSASGVGASEDFETSEGIVVSINMSDKEISKCFKRLEQNYLNSIGLGSSASSLNEDSSNSASPGAIVSTSDDGAEQSVNKQGFPVPPVPMDLIPVKQVSNSLNDKQPATVGAGPPLAATNDLEHVYDDSPATSYELHFPALSNFNEHLAHQTSQIGPTTNNQHQVNRNHHRNNHQLSHYQQALNNQHYTNHHASQWSPWAQRVDLSDSRSNSRAGGSSVASAAGDQKKIKLTSLPISKELLREIQSVGSLQSLNLGLQQGDIAIMASDLEAISVPASNVAERVSSMNAGANQAASIRQIVRDTELLNAIDSHDAEPTKYSGVSGIVVGWGWVRENDNDEAQQQQVTGGAGQRSSQSVTLQKVRLPILRNDDCEAWFRSQEKKITLLPSQFCAGFNLGGKDACRGDSGGPMIIEDSTDTGRYKLIGIVSAGIGCARPSLPGLYTRVASFLPWIHAQIMHN